MCSPLRMFLLKTTFLLCAKTCIIGSTQVAIDFTRRVKLDSCLISGRTCVFVFGREGGGGREYEDLFVCWAHAHRETASLGIGRQAYLEDANHSVCVCVCV